MSRPCLIAYDIAQPRRLRRLHRKLSRLAMPLQYSVFYAEVTDAGLARVVALIEGLIDPKVDDVRVYQLPGGGWARTWGVSPLPAGIQYIGLPHGLPGRTVEPREAEQPSDPGEGSGPPALPRPVVGPAARRQARRIEARTRTGRRNGLQLL